MFIYEKYEFVDNELIYWFKATENSIYEVAYLYQEGLLKNIYIRHQPYTNTISIGVINMHNFQFVINNKYYLILKPVEKLPEIITKIDKIICIKKMISIKQVYTLDENVPNEFRFKSSNLVKKSTLKKLFRSDIDLIPIINELYVEYNDVQVIESDSEESIYSENEYNISHYFINT